MDFDVKVGCIGQGEFSWNIGGRRDEKENQPKIKDRDRLGTNYTNDRWIDWDGCVSKEYPNQDSMFRRIYKYDLT